MFSEAELAVGRCVSRGYGRWIMRGNGWRELVILAFQDRSILPEMGRGVGVSFELMSSVRRSTSELKLNLDVLRSFPS